jgi:hypothetical protein
MQRFYLIMPIQVGCNFRKAQGGLSCNFFGETDDMPTRIGKVIGSVIVTIIYSGIAAVMVYAALPGLRAMLHWFG